MPEYVENLIDRMWNMAGGYDYIGETEDGLKFQDMQNSMCTMTFDDWVQVEDYLITHGG